jgi:magnesium chelatase family protein
MVEVTHSYLLQGLQAVKIDVEVSTIRGVPQFIVIGLASKVVGEAKDRITTALQSLDVRLRSRRTIINLAPAEIKKTSASLDLAIAVSLIKANQQLVVDLSTYAFFGELSLEGNLKPVTGILPLVLAAKAAHFTDVVIPWHNRSEVATITGIGIHPLHHLREALLFLRGKADLPTLTPHSYKPQLLTSYEYDFAQIKGLTTAKRALEIAAAGSHHILLTGAPGLGKTLLAKALPSILPPLTENEALSITQIYSAAGILKSGMVTHRPFRTPHHTTALQGLLGSYAASYPGEASLAHLGVLFMDEILEFSPKVLNALRQPLEDGYISFSKPTGSITLPTAFMLVGAANPCPCGHFGSSTTHCSCSPNTIENYQKRLANPLRDRIDITVSVDIGETTHQSLPSNLESSASILQRVEQAVIRQRQRCQKHKISFTPNAKLNSSVLLELINLEPQALRILNQAAGTLNLSPRSYYKVLKVALTIADLAGETAVTSLHIAEALQYR